MIRAVPITALAMLASAAALAQTAPAPAFEVASTFEVASVKPNKSGSGNSSTHSNKGEIRMVNISLKQCIQMAYDVKDYSLSGPEWLDSERFDIVAKPSAPTRDEQLRPMMQSLLVERFKLTTHRESKSLPAYALVVDKKGAKVQPMEAGGGGSGTSTGRGRITGTKMSMSRFADALARYLDRPVQDLTKLDGVFDLKLEWTDDRRPIPAGEGGERREPDNVTGPSIFSALQEQLGLKLEARKLPVEILVVDHVERVPTEN